MLELAGRRCLIVGGGEVAARKALRLAQAGADLTVIAPSIDERIRQVEGVSLFERPFQKGDTAGFSLVFAATGDREVNSIVAEDARDYGVWVNAVDDPERCDFIAPSVVERGDLMIAVSTSGKSPALSRCIREELERQYGPEYEEFIGLLGSLRPRVKSKYGTQKEREAVFNRLIDCGILELLREGKREEALEKALECI
jgi:precorrin-2 dehydrogenase/sirohydrochlorin ferrochelatase